MNHDVLYNDSLYNSLHISMTKSEGEWGSLIFYPLINLKTGNNYGQTWKAKLQGQILSYLVVEYREEPFVIVPIRSSFSIQMT